MPGTTTAVVVAFSACAALAACAVSRPPSAPERLPVAQVTLPPPAPATAEDAGVDAPASEKRAPTVKSAADPVYGGGLAGVAPGGMAGNSPVGVRAVGDAGLGRLRSAPSPAAAPAARERAAIRRTIHANVAGFRFCYEQVLTRDPTLKAKLTVQFTIDARGRVSKASLLNPSGESGFDACILKVVEQLSFPRPITAKTLVIRYPLTFQP